MQFLRAHAESRHALPSRLVATGALDALRCADWKGTVLRRRIEADSWLVRAASPLTSTAAFEGLARQPALGAPAKVAWSAGDGFELVAEASHGGSRRDAEEEVCGALDDALHWFANGGGTSTRATSTPSAALIEILQGAGCFVRPAAADACFVDVNLGGCAYRALVGERADARVQVSFPATTVRVEGERSLQAAALFALEANHRLRLARVSTTSLSSDRLRVVWDVVLNGGPCLMRRFPDALEALVVAREETSRALRMLRSHDVAGAYLASGRRPHAAQRKPEEE
jgi:hypothetical protein